MCVYKNHAFIYFLRPPSWSGTVAIIYLPEFITTHTVNMCTWYAGNTRRVFNCSIALVSLLCLLLDPAAAHPECVWPSPSIGCFPACCYSASSKTGSRVCSYQERGHPAHVRKRQYLMFFRWFLPSQTF